MSTIRSFIKKEPVLMIATLAALFSCLLVPPDREYLSYFDFRTLSLLYCLMVVISGFQQAGLFSRMAHTFCRKAASIRKIGLVLVLLCFFSSMLITNDVALLTFVPFSIIILGGTDQKTDLIHIIVLQTVAANLGSMLTPVGNPQNLFLYSFYNLSIREFLLTMLPFYTLSLIIISGACFLLSNKPNQFNIGKAPEIQKGSLALLRPFRHLSAGCSPASCLALDAGSCVSVPSFLQSPAPDRRRFHVAAYICGIFRLCR